MGAGRMAAGDGGSVMPCKEPLELRKPCESCGYPANSLDKQGRCTPCAMNDKYGWNEEERREE